jgi:hypothetical protein
MSKSLRVSALVGLMVPWAVAAVAGGPDPGRPGQPPTPSGVIHVSAGGENLILWPYTTSDFETPSDPINLVFPDADPRGIRQELMRLDGDRSGSPFAGLPFGDCRWTDAMGYEGRLRPARALGAARSSSPASIRELRWAIPSASTSASSGPGGTRSGMPTSSS